MDRPTTLGDTAYFISSKNAGPHRLTVDIVFASAEEMNRVVDSHVLTEETIAAAYQLRPEDVTLQVVSAASSIKVSFPRRLVAGDIGETDIYGAQQHVPLMQIPLEPQS